MSAGSRKISWHSAGGLRLSTRLHASKKITDAQENVNTNAQGRGGADQRLPGPPQWHGMVDNVKTVDTCRRLARANQFDLTALRFRDPVQVFILNASRRLFSDRFFTSALPGILHTLEWSGS